MRLLRISLRAQGVPVAACHAEARPGRFEINADHFVDMRHAESTARAAAVTDSDTHDLEVS